MDGPLAQIVALTCHGNGLLRGLSIPQFFPANTTCRYVDSINFAARRKPLFGKEKEVVTSNTPDAWLAALPQRDASGIRLMRQPRNDPDFSDRMSAGLVGGGGTWMMQVLVSGGRMSEYWAARWEVWDRNAPQSRIWRVTYLLLARIATPPGQTRELSAIKRDLSDALTAIHSFATRENVTGFIECFADALHALDHPDAQMRNAYADLAPDGLLNDEQRSLLNASQRAWVFGAMGSWNDMGFDQVPQREYDAVSDRLFNVVTEAIAAVATSTAPAASK